DLDPFPERGGTLGGGVGERGPQPGRGLLGAVVPERGELGPAGRAVQQQPVTFGEAAEAGGHGDRPGEDAVDAALAQGRRDAHAPEGNEWPAPRRSGHDEAVTSPRRSPAPRPRGAWPVPPDSCTRAPSAPSSSSTANAATCSPTGGSSPTRHRPPPDYPGGHDHRARPAAPSGLRHLRSAPLAGGARGGARRAG